MAQRDVQMENLLNSILQKFSECSDGSGNLREDREQEMSLFLRDRLERVKPERMNELLKKLVNIGSTKIIECIANIDITIRLLVTYNIRTALHDSLKAKVQPPIDALSKIYGHVNYSALDEEGCTISHLHVAVKEKCAAAVANLLKWETSEIAFEEFKKNFSYLIKYDGRETLEVLLQTGFKSDEYVNEKRRTPLSHLCRRISEHRYYYGTTPEPGDDVAAIRLLVQYGANVNSPDVNGRTPLMVLFNSGITEVDKQLDIARLLLDNGAEVNRCDENGETILHVVLRVWHLEEYHGPSHDPRRRNEPCLRVLKLLLERGAVINARNHDGQTPLLIAVVYCNLDAVELLLEHGANLGGVNFSGGYMEPSNGFLRNLEMTQNAIAILKLLESRGFTIRISSTMTWLHFLMGFLPSQKYYEARYVLAYVEDPERIRKYFDYIPNVIEDNEELDEEYTRRSEKERHAMIAIIEIDNYLNVFNELRLPVSAKMISVLEHTGRELINKYNLSYIDATTDDEFRSYVIEQRSIDEELRRAEVTQISETATLLDVCRHSSEAAYEKLKISNYESVLEDYDNFKTNFPYIGIYLKGCITKALVKGQFKEKTRKMSMKNPA